MAGGNGGGSPHLGLEGGGGWFIPSSCPRAQAGALVTQSFALPPAAFMLSPHRVGAQRGKHGPSLPDSEPLLEKGRGCGRGGPVAGRCRRLSIFLSSPVYSLQRRPDLGVSSACFINGGARVCRVIDIYGRKPSNVAKLESKPATLRPCVPCSYVQNSLYFRKEVGQMPLQPVPQP